MSRSILFSYTNYPSLIEKLAEKGVKLDNDQLAKHGSFTFDLQSVSRAASHQIVRHRLASYSQQSQRYVKVTRSYGYLKPASIPDDLKIPVVLHDQKLELNFADIMDLTRQVEEGYANKGLKAEDSRYVRPNAATTNIVMSMSPKVLRHFFNLRCAPDAQWEIRDLAWAMYASVRFVAPDIIGRLPIEESSEYVKKRVAIVDDLVREEKPAFDHTRSGELYNVPVGSRLDLTHPVETLVRRY